MQKQSHHIKSILPWIEWFGVVLTIILLPLDRLPYLHRIPFSLGLISLFALIIATLWRLWQQFQNGGVRSLKLHGIVAILLGLPIIGYAITSLGALDRSVAFDTTMTLAPACARAFCFFVLLKANRGLWSTARKTIYIVTGAVVAFGLFQYVFDTWGASTAVTDLRICCTSNSTYVFPRVHSTALEPLYFDHFLMIPLWLLSFDFWRNKQLRRSKKHILLFVLTATLFVLTIARSATIGIIVASIIFALAGRTQKDFKQAAKYLAKLWVLGVSTAVVLVLMSGVASSFIDKKAQYNTQGVGSLSKFGTHAVDFDDGSSKTRYELWPKSITYFKERPIFGVGPDNSRIRLNEEKYKDGIQHNRLQPFNNDLLGLIVDTGLVGLLTFAPLLGALLFAIYTQARNSWEHTYAMFALILIGMAVQSSFFHSILLSRTWFVVGILLITLETTKSSKKKKRKT